MVSIKRCVGNIGQGRKGFQPGRDAPWHVRQLGCKQKPPGCNLPPLAGLAVVVWLAAQGFRYRSTPAYKLAAPSGACILPKGEMTEPP